MFESGSDQAIVSQSDALPAAVGWVEGVLLGSLGTTIAVLAVAGLGFAMLQGRLSTRDGIRVVLGCFILFGAPAIARGLASMAQADNAPIVIPTPSPTPKRPPPPLPSNTDPYAGASVPM
jgi:type IV secretion system protein VirB2